MNRIIIAGIGTDVGKTVVAAVITTLLNGDYWKPIQCGSEEDLDSVVIKKLINTDQHHVYEPIYSFKKPLSPHHAARLEQVVINPNTITPPDSTRPLIIEGIGGIFTPLNTQILSGDLFASWNGQWIIVSKNYLGSINHTLLTIEALKSRNVLIAGLIFNGEPNPDTESIILNFSELPFLGRLLPEQHINKKTIQRYVKKWHPLSKQLNL
jgi:dethiobiotin synthetase